MALRLARALCLAALLAAPAATGAPAAAGLSDLYGSPGFSPPGANDFSCRPRAPHRVPVILVHGTGGDMSVSWNMISPALKRDGYCVFALDLEKRATVPLERSGARLAELAERVLAATGAEKVSFVGHSQGGILARYYATRLGGLDRTDDIVGLAAPNHGTTMALAPLLGTVLDCAACPQQLAGSPFLRDLNEGDEAPPPVSYTTLSTRYDELVTPYTSQALSGPRVTNVVLQDRCPLDVAEHLAVLYDPAVLEWLRNALGRSGPADPGFHPTCLGLGGNPGIGAPEAEPPHETGSRWRLGISSRAVRVSSRGRGRVALSCRAPAEAVCAGRLALTGARDVRLGDARFRVRGGHRRAVALRLSRRGGALLRREHTLRGRLAAVMPDGRGGLARFGRTVRLRLSR